MCASWTGLRIGRERYIAYIVVRLARQGEAIEFENSTHKNGARRVLWSGWPIILVRFKYFHTPYAKHTHRPYCRRTSAIRMAHSLVRNKWSVSGLRQYQANSTMSNIVWNEREQNIHTNRIYMFSKNSDQCVRICLFAAFAKYPSVHAHSGVAWRRGEKKSWRMIIMIATG